MVLYWIIVWLYMVVSVSDSVKWTTQRKPLFPGNYLISLSSFYEDLQGTSFEVTERVSPMRSRFKTSLGRLPSQCCPWKVTLCHGSQLGLFTQMSFHLLSHFPPLPEEPWSVWIFSPSRQPRCCWLLTYCKPISAPKLQSFEGYPGHVQLFLGIS